MHQIGAKKMSLNRTAFRGGCPWSGHFHARHRQAGGAGVASLSKAQAFHLCAVCRAGNQHLHCLAAKTIGETRSEWNWAFWGALWGPPMCCLSGPSQLSWCMETHCSGTCRFLASLIGPFFLVSTKFTGIYPCCFVCLFFCVVAPGLVCCEDSFSSLLMVNDQHRQLWETGTSSTLLY